MFSFRTNWNTAPNRLAELVQTMRLRGDTIVDLTESNPTKCHFDYPAQKILTALSDEAILSYHPDPRGHLRARDAIAEFYTSTNIAVRPEQIILTSSTSEAYSFLLQLLCNAGDEILVPQPSYPLIDYLCQLGDVTLRRYRLAYDGEWYVDFESLQTGITERTRALILVHPNNPTGSFLKQKEFDRICFLAQKHHLAIIADEVFASSAFSSDNQYATILNTQHSMPLFSLNGISKLLGLPQLKLSWIIVGGNSRQANEALNRLDIIADTFLSVNTMSQVALPILLQQSENMGNQIRKRIQCNYELLQKAFIDTAVSLFSLEGGWSAILQLPHNHTDEDWACKLLDRHRILVHPGHFFDIEQKSCLVVSLLPDPAVFKEALIHIRQCLEQS